MDRSKNPWMGLVVLGLGCGGRMEAEVAADLPTSTSAGGGVGVGGSGGAVTTYFGTGGAVTTSYAAGGFGPSNTTPVTCSSSTNLVAVAASSRNGNQVDGICGVGGGFYAYSDSGLDGIYGTADDSVQVPGIDINAAYADARLGPCSGGRCCISGRTNLWPRIAGTPDYQAAVWGGGIGLRLNAASDGSASPYAGPARGFVVTVTGTLNGQEFRIAYPQVPGDSGAPYSSGHLGVNSVAFVSVTCPSWASNCLGVSNQPYDLQVQLVGGDVSGPYEVCITSITPMLPLL
jgi:hypothetical protein